jgi:hypothetical protein
MFDTEPCLKHPFALRALPHASRRGQENLKSASIPVPPLPFIAKRGGCRDDALAFCSPFRHTPPSSKYRLVAERKDLLRNQQVRVRKIPFSRVSALS